MQTSNADDVQTTVNTGPLGSGPHIVQEGECFLSISYQRGFFWKTLWNLPQNSELRNVRRDPGLLLVGDRVMIPERQTKEVPANTDALHRYVKQGVPAKLRVVVEYEDMPVSNSDYRLVLDGLARQGTTDAQGLLEVSIPPNASQGVLEIDGLSFTLQLGALDPASEDIGIQQRLKNLGFYHGELDGIVGPQTRAAITEFQARTGLKVSGELDDSTRQKLIHRHDQTHEELPDPTGSDDSSSSADQANG